MKKLWIFFIVASILLVSCGESKAIKIVRQGYFADYDSKTVGKAVDEFFGKSKWTSDEPADKELAGFTLVNVIGEITYGDKPAMAEIQFLVDEKKQEFVFHAFEIDGVPQANYMLIGLLEKMFESD